MAGEVTLAVRDKKNRDKNAEAKKRNDYRKGLSDADQIKRLDGRLGTGIGARIERAKLNMVQL